MRSTSYLDENDSTSPDSITVNRYQLHRVLSGNEERPAEWLVGDASQPESRSEADEWDLAHALGAGWMGHFVTAYANDIEDAALLGQNVVVGGLIKEYGGWPQGPDAIELTDLQGRILVVIPSGPSRYGLWANPVASGSVVLVAGTVADAAWPFGRHVELHRGMSWEQAAANGPERFATVMARTGFEWQ